MKDSLVAGLTPMFTLNPLEWLGDKAQENLGRRVHLDDDVDLVGRHVATQGRLRLDRQFHSECR